jgi:hypothetical protein
MYVLTMVCDDPSCACRRSLIASTPARPLNLLPQLRSLGQRKSTFSPNVSSPALSSRDMGGIENVSDWRELIADLTANQAAELDRLGARLVAAGIEGPELDGAMLDAARQAVTDKITTGYAGVPTLPGATKVLPRCPDSDDPADASASRHFEGIATEVAGVHLLSAGFQCSDGEIQRWVSITVADGYAELDAAELRRLAAHLLDAAHDLELGHRA